MYTNEASNRNIINKMMRLFIIQAISGFVSHDYNTGIHFLNEIKTHYAQNPTMLDGVLKSLAKEIIKSLDMFAPGSNASTFFETNEEAKNPQQELNQINRAAQEKKVMNPQLESILEKRKKKHGESNNATGSLDEALNLGALKLGENSPTADIIDDELPAENPALNTAALIENQDNAILSILLSRKQKRGKLSAEDAKILELLKSKRDSQPNAQKSNSTLDSIISRRKKRKHNSENLWD